MIHNIRYHRVFVFFAVLTFCAAAAWGQKPVYRDWMDITGEKRNARLLRLEAGRAYLETRKNDAIDIPLEKLSPQDMDYLQKNVAAGMKKPEVLANLPAAEEFLEMAVARAAKIPATRDRFHAFLKIGSLQQELKLDYSATLETLRKTYQELDGSEQKFAVTRPFIAFLVAGGYFYEAQRYLFIPDSDDILRNPLKEPSADGKPTVPGFGGQPPVFTPAQRIQLYRFMTECLIGKREHYRALRILDILEDSMDRTSWQLQEHNYAEIAVLEAKMGMIAEAYQTVAIIRTLNTKMQAYCRILPLLHGTPREKDIPAMLEHVYHFILQKSERAMVAQEVVEAGGMMNAFLSAYLTLRRMGYALPDEAAAAAAEEKYLKTARKLLLKIPESDRHSLLHRMLELLVLGRKNQAARELAQMPAKSKIDFLTYLADREIQANQGEEALKTLLAVQRHILMIPKPENQLGDTYRWAERMQSLGKTKEVGLALAQSQNIIGKIKNENTRAAAWERFAQTLVTLNRLDEAKALAVRQTHWEKRNRLVCDILHKHLENDEFLSAYGLLNVLESHHGLAADALLDFARRVEEAGK